MSLVGLKTLLFGRPSKAMPMDLPLSAASASSSDTIAVADDTDLESQTLVEKTQEPYEQEKPRNSMGSARIVSDATIGLSDGLTVPFALTAGLSALGSTKMVIFGGLAELIAGAISMGLGGYLGAKSELYVWDFFFNFYFHLFFSGERARISRCQCNSITEPTLTLCFQGILSGDTQRHCPPHLVQPGRH